MDQLGNRVMVREGDSRSPTLTPFYMALGSGHILLRPPESFFYISYISFMDVS
jgi:hypothetical protein